MKRKTFLSLLLILFMSVISGQTTQLPLREWNSGMRNPLVFYISGDGGYTNFSETLCGLINKRGYDVTSLNSKSYFWDKKTPKQTTKDIVAYLNSQFAKRKNQQFILTGYSFGAEIVPFVVNRLSDSMKKKLVTVVLLSPSASTDFEIHIWNMFGAKTKGSMDVVAEINKMGSQKTTTIFGIKDDNFPISDVKLKNYSNEQLPGGHHFGGNINEVAKTMMRYF
jgi:type IV secretory pathway VirJ component